MSRVESWFNTALAARMCSDAHLKRSGMTKHYSDTSPQHITWPKEREHDVSWEKKGSQDAPRDNSKFLCCTHEQQHCNIHTYVAAETLSDLGISKFG